MNKKISVLSVCAILSLCILMGCGTRELPGQTQQENSSSVSESQSSGPDSSSETDSPESKKETTATTTVAKTTTTAKITTATQSQTTASSMQSTTAAATEASVSNDIVFTIKQGSSWESDGKTVYQFDCMINNGTNASISNWSITVPLTDPDSSLFQGWNAKYSISESSLTITPDDFNAEIQSGSNISLGFQITSSSPLDITQARFNSSGISISPAA